MSRRRNNNNIAASLVVLLLLLVQLALFLIVRSIVFTCDFITFYTSGYKQKSGNSFVETYFNKGNYGEFVLYRKVCRIFGKESVMTNLYLDNENTEMTEIDVLAVSNKGIYVYEMKNYAGYIYGSEGDKQWTQVLNKWTKHNFYNPLRQNYAHTKAVENYLDVSADKIFPIVVFSNRSKLSKINIEDNQNVFQYRGAKRFVKKNEKINTVVISEEEKEGYLIKLLERSNMPEEIKIRHIEQVRELKGI